MLSLDGRKNARPIAIVKGGKYNGEIVYIVPEKQTNEVFKSKTKKGEGLILKDGTFEVLPSEKTRVGFIAGPSGSGKSTKCAEYIKYYKQMFPKAMFILFSQKSHDAVLDKLRPHRVLVDESLIEQPIEIDEFPKNSIVVFDDIDNLSNKVLQKIINNLKSKLMEIGRAQNINVYVIQHLVNGLDRNLTRTTMNEMQSFTFFGSSGSIKPIKYNLSNYFGLSDKDIDKILDINSRSVTILKEAPQVLISERYICLLKDL